MEEKSSEIIASNTGADDKETEAFQTIIIEDIKYKTKLTKKFLARKPYQRVDPKKLHAFIPGTIRNVFVKKGKRVKAGEKLLELEAMKMVNTFFAEFNAVILDIPVKSGQAVSKNQLLIHFK